MILTGFSWGSGQVAFLAGILYTAVGVLNLGWLMNFLSHSVIQGFMSGASIVIALSQVNIEMHKREDLEGEKWVTRR